MRIYHNIVENAKIRTTKDYVEKHHIIPKCLGGSNDKENLVELTAREHFICHWLLAKHHNSKQLWNAFSMMCIGAKNHHRYISSRTFEILRKARSLASKGENNPMYGKPSACKSHTEETKMKIRMSKLGKKRTPFKRSPASDETKRKISESKKGKPRKSKELSGTDRKAAPSMPGIYQ
jgi:hypothetical protein